MGRVTRKKAAELAESLHIDEDAVLELDQENSNIIDAKPAAEPTASPTDRSPLGEIATSSGNNNSQSDLGAQELRKSTRSKKGGKKGAKGNNDLLSASIATQPEISGMINAAAEALLPDQSDVIPSPASERAAEELMRDMDICEFDLDQILVMVSQANAGAAGTPAEEIASNESTTTRVKFSSDEPSIIGEESESRVKSVEPSAEVQEISGLDSPARINPKSPGLQIQMPFEIRTTTMNSASTSMLDAPASPLPTAIPKTVANLRADTPAKRSTSNKENVSPLEDTSSQLDGSDALGPASNVATPATIEQSSVPESQDPVTALSTYDNAVELTKRATPETQAPQEKPRVKREKVAPVVRGTKASQARISLAQNPEPANSRASTIGRPSLSNAGLGRSQSVRTSTATRPQPETITRRVPSATAATTATNNTSIKKESPIIPHSKPRPMSMSFPAPPPPPKSTKAPTQSTFTLPGEAVAAKLKAAREARALKESEEGKKAAFKARPVPAGLARAPSVRQTAASRGRESLMASKDLKEDKGGLARSTLAGGASSFKSSTTTANAATSRSTTAKSTGDLNVRKRVSTTQANTGKPRSSLLSASTTTTSAAAAHPLTSRNVSATTTSTKGKEVFNRSHAAQATEAKMKAEKEAATRKARIEAAERGRVASREWAERQKRAGEVRNAAAAVAAREHEVVELAGDGNVGVGGVETS